MSVRSQYSSFQLSNFDSILIFINIELRRSSEYDIAGPLCFEVSVDYDRLRFLTMKFTEKNVLFGVHS